MARAHPIHAALYDLMNRAEERAYRGRLRDRLCSLARGQVVEIGAGTGLNFPHYRLGLVEQVVAVEPDPYMRRLAERRAAESLIRITRAR